MNSFDNLLFFLIVIMKRNYYLTKPKIISWATV